MFILMLCLSNAWGMTLEDAWRDVEASSEESTMISEQERQSTFAGDQALAGLSPKVSVGGNFTLNQREVSLDFAASLPDSVLALLGDASFGDPTIIQRKSFFDASLTVSQPLIDARVFAGVGAARTAVKAGADRATDARSDLRLAVARAYWAVLVARDYIDIAKAGLEVAQKHAEQAHLLVEVGSALQQVNVQADMAVARAERDLAGAVAQSVAADAAFAALVNHPIDALVEPTAQATSVASVDEALRDAWAKRPDLRAAEAQARLARAQYTVSRLSWVPTIDGRFTEAWSENTGFSGEPWNWQIGLAARWTLWDGGYRLIDHAQTHSNATIADSAARQARQQVEVDVRQAWAESDRAHAAWVAAERERTLAEENLRLADVSFQAGASTFLDLEDARVSLESARVRELQERMNVHLGALGLQHAIGAL